MTCDRLPAPLPRAEAAPPPAPVEEDKGGWFHNPFPSLIKPTTGTEREAGVGPPASSR